MRSGALADPEVLWREPTGVVAARRIIAETPMVRGPRTWKPPD
jgi:hypothetical protein